MAEELSTDLSFELPAEVACPSCGKTIDAHGIEAFEQVACPHCGRTFNLPAQFGAFILLERIAHGGMGAVFRAYDPSLKRPVAIKVLRRALGSDADFVQLFQHEARMLARLNDRNIVQVYSAGQEQGQPYIVMELVDGAKLSTLIKPGAGLDEKQVLKTAIDVVRGLKAASDAGLAHGDMKPENILFDRKGTAKVVDFGLARFRGEEFQPGVIWGTPYYIAPEVVRGKQPNMQSDIYSLGCSLYFALTGHYPFNKETMTATVTARLRESPPPLGSLRAGLHPETTAIIERMLEADMLRRYPNYNSLLDDLKAAMKALDAGAPPASTAKKTGGRAWRYVVTPALIVIALAAWFMASPRKKPAAPPAKKTIVIKTKVARDPAKPAKLDAPPRPATPVPAPSARKANDDAADYENWTDGSTGGEGFAPWVLRSGGKTSGFFVGSSGANEGAGQIDTGGKAWGMFASGGEMAEAWRTLAGDPLQVARESVRIGFDHGFIGPDGASVGLGVQNAASNNLWEFFSRGGETNYVVHDALGMRDSGIPLSAESLLVEFRLVSESDYAATVIAGLTTFTLKGSLISRPDASVRIIHLWNHDAGPGNIHDAYFNNLSVAPVR